LKKNFIYEEISSKEGVETINIESVVAAVKNLAISRWKKKIEEKIDLARRMNEQTEKTNEEMEGLIGELETIAK